MMDIQAWMLGQTSQSYRTMTRVRLLSMRRVISHVRYNVRSHRCRKRFTVLAIHRRFGKTVCAVNELIYSALNCKLHNPRCAYIAPFYKQAKSVAWDYLKTFTVGLPGAKAYESELRVDIPLQPMDGKPNIARIQLFGADNPDALRGMYFDDVCFDEFGMQPLTIWSEVVRPALADRKGCAIFLGTPNGKNHFYEKFQEATRHTVENHPEWFARTYRADETHVIDPIELESAKENMPESDYRQEFLCDWAAAIKGSFYADQIHRAREDGRVMRVPYEPGLRVYCAFDLGIDDITAVWFAQFFRSEIRLIDYQEWTDTGLQDVLKDISQMPYIYADMFMPWDINIRELTSGATRLELIEDLGFDVVVCKRQSIEDGINAVRHILPRCYWDEGKTQRGLDCLENYRKRWDGRAGVFLQKPEHDEYSHGADAMRYLALMYEPLLGEPGGARNGRKPKVKRSI